MKPEYLRDHILPAAYAVLPKAMRAPAASAMLLAVGLQESRLTHRRQIRGPARGYWQFERAGGVRGVLHHHATADHAERACAALDVEAEETLVYGAIEHGDVLAAAFARLLLWTYPGPLPERDDASEGWRQYLDTWRPGKPHPGTWAEHYARGWALVDGG